MSPLVRPTLRAVRIVALLLAVGLGAGCRTPSVPPDQLAGTTWRLTGLVENGAARAEVPPDELVFDADGQGLRLRSCNVCNGVFSQGQETLAATRLACTRRGCPDGRLELERYVEGTSRWRRTGDALVLTVNDNLNGIEATLTFARVPDTGGQ